MSAHNLHLSVICSLLSKNRNFLHPLPS